MKNFTKKCILFLLACYSVNVSAQTGGRDFKAIDDYVRGLGPLDSMSMGTINNVVSNKFEDKIDRARAIYDWIALNITYDIKAARSNTTLKNTPTDVLLSRKAVGIGFASLFQDMCSSADIRCLTVDGFVKNSTEQIGERGAEVNHSWAVVQLGESPDTWYYVDPAMGSGYPDPEMKVFTKSFSDAYFFSEKAAFNLNHYPDNGAWKLGSAPKSRGDFYDLPLVKVAAMEFDIKKFSPDNGKMRAKVGKAVYFSYTLSSKNEISKVTLAMGSKKKYKVKEVDFVFTGSVLSFSYKFEEDGGYPLTILVNGKEFMSYNIEVN